MDKPVIKKRLTPAGAADIRAINERIPGIRWVTCRSCGELCPSEAWSGVWNRHLMCLEPSKEPQKRNVKRDDPNQGQLI